MTDNGSAITVSLEGGATYEVYEKMFYPLAGVAGDSRGGWNISLNGEDMNVARVSGEGITVRPPLNEDWDTFGDTKFVSWDDVATIVIF
jgi:hypothetical protein